MKPLTLTLQAFGPFSGVEHIDFRTLGDSPLFLINGPTGSGKSSILDAICYALYGETTGSERTGDQMRCDYADVKLLTTITFEFELAGVRYQITRSPDQEVPKQRGEGMTKKSHAAQLINLDRDALIANKPKPVATAIQELIGLDVKQFRQVMVIPQGKFRELLTASSKEREAIFGQLFQTQIYTTIERVLFERAAGIRKAKEEFDNQIKGALDVASMESESQLSQKLVELAPVLEQAGKELKQAEIVRANAQQELDTALELEKKFALKTELEQAQRKHLQGSDAIELTKSQLDAHRASAAIQPDYDHHLRLTKESATLAERLQTGRSKIAQAQQNQSKAQAAFDDAKKANDDAESLKQERFELSALAERLKELDSKKMALQQANQQLGHVTAAQTSLAEQLNAMTQQEEGLRAAFVDAEKQKSQLSELTLSLDIENKKQQALQSIASIDAQLLDQQKQRAELVGVITSQEPVVNKTRQTRTEAEIAWHSGQAALLAASLEQDNPCPVCGSLEHPNIATFAGEVVTLDQVNELREVETAAKDELSRQQQLMAELESQIATQVTRRQEWLDSLGVDQQQDVAHLTQSVQQRIAELSTRITALQALNMELMQTQYQQATAKRVELSQQLEQTTNQVNEATNQVQQLSGVVSSLEASNNTGYATALAVLGRQQAIETELVQKAAALEKAMQALKQAGETLAKFESHLDTLQKQFEELELSRENASTAWKAALESSVFESEQTFLNAKLPPESVEQKAKQIEHYQHEGIRLKEQLNLLTAQLKEQSMPAIEQLMLNKQQADAAYQSVLVQHQTHQSQQNNLLQVRKRIETLRLQNEELDKQYQVVGTLSDVANGRTGNKISLHRFVLGVLLDDVLIQASQRLRLMSKGRYDLKRKESRSKGNAGSGLDLIVEDAYTGKWRDVATLSGGESFMAALSLALGLSDVVQSYSGGIRLDTLFIDEGFGSLDPESLDLAVQTLVELQQSGRTIGIISHVSELKEQMPLRLDVHASRVGSTVSLVN
ncbi:SMC family ATPase [Vibrio sp. 10N]|uniref:SMC family ATPase n=1 Tax=Vibrio sp. 10N TaxID=3058938 RepID=UPI00281401D3|nr:SMC family ATPase [Vibrio sp. 10N]